MATRRRRVPTAKAPKSRDDDYFEDDDDDDYEDEAPRRRRRSETRSEERPVRRRRDDDYEDDDDDDDYEDEAPRRRRSRARDGDDGGSGRRRAPRRHRDDDADDEGGGRMTLEDLTRDGRAGARALKDEMGGFAPELRVTKDDVLVMFLDEDPPLTTYGQHWVERPGKKSFVCLKDVCPLCKAGDRARPVPVYNVLLLADADGPTDPLVYLLRAGTRLDSAIAKADQGRGGPISGRYWAISSNGETGGKANYTVLGVKERDLEEDWDVVPLSEDDIDDWMDKAYTKADAVQIPTVKELRAIVDEAFDDE